MMTNIRELRDLRKRVRGTVNVTGAGGRLGERPGARWQINLETRQVEWTPYNPWTQGPLDDHTLRYLTRHEASHDEFSGLYTTKRIKDGDKGRFHRFVNAIEDIRVDRLSALKFGTFREAKLHVDLDQRQTVLPSMNPEGLSLVDAVAKNAIYSFDIGEPPFGTDFAIEAATRLWPKLDRIANSRSTQEVATALEPIFLKLQKIEREEAERKRREEEERRRREEEERQKRIEEILRRHQEQAEQEQAEQQQADGDDSQDSQPDIDDGPDSLEPGKVEDDEGESTESSGREPGEEDADGGHGGQDDASGSSTSDDVEEEEADEEGPRSPGTADDDDEVSPSEVDGPDGLDEADEGGIAPEPEPDPDPFDELDELPDAGADEPTDRPVKSDGDEGTEPLAIGDELAGMAGDAVDAATQSALDAMDAARKQGEMRAAADRDRQLGKREVPPTSEGIAAYHDRQAKLRSKINSLSQRLVTVLRHNAMDNPSTGHRRGRLDTGKAYRAEAGNPRVFRKPGVVGGHDYTFGLLVDVSGSMYSSGEIEGAFDAAVLVGEALERAGLGIFVILWDSLMRHVKPLAEQLKNHRGSIGTVCKKSGGSTVESIAISRALDEFKLVRGRKMLICVTDGVSDTVDESRDLLEEAELAGIKALTIRIGGEPGAHYKHGFRVEHADELVRLLPAVINDVVRRGA